MLIGFWASSASFLLPQLPFSWQLLPRGISFLSRVSLVLSFPTGVCTHAPTWLSFQRTRSHLGPLPSQVWQRQVSCGWFCHTYGAQAASQGAVLPSFRAWLPRLCIAFWVFAHLLTLLRGLCVSRLPQVYRFRVSFCVSPPLISQGHPSLGSDYWWFHR